MKLSVNEAKLTCLELAYYSIICLWAGKVTGLSEKRAPGHLKYKRLFSMRKGIKERERVYSSHQVDTLLSRCDD